VALLLLAACGTSSPARSGPPPTRAAAPSRVVTKLLVFVVENHSLDEMRRQLPYTFGLARSYAYAKNYTAMMHPSLPNYLAITGGSTFGVTDNGPPSSNEVRGPSVFGQAISLGKTAKLYADGMPHSCAIEDGGHRYVVKHNPWAYFVDERALCDKYDAPLTELRADVDQGRLPHAGMVVPNLCHDAHDSDCDLGDADSWLRTEVGDILEGPDFKSGHLAVVVTADEDDRSQGNLVLTAVIHPSQRGTVVTTPLTHYSLTRLYDEVLGASLLGQAAAAPSMAAAFKLPVRPG
jgi:hypothetical protein